MKHIRAYQAEVETITQSYFSEHRKLDLNDLSARLVLNAQYVERLSAIILNCAIIIDSSKVYEDRQDAMNLIANIKGRFTGMREVEEASKLSRESGV